MSERYVAANVVLLLLVAVGLLARCGASWDDVAPPVHDGANTGDEPPMFSQRPGADAGAALSPAPSARP